MTLFGLFCTVLLIVCVIQSANGAQILGVFPMPAPSHYFLGSALMRGLAEKGHDVTVISPFGENNPPKGGKYRNILTAGLYEKWTEKMKDNDMFKSESSNPFIGMLFFTSLIPQMNEDVLKHEAVQNFIKAKNETFDVVIVEQFVNDAMRAFATHFNAPLMSFKTVGASVWVNIAMGNPSSPSYIGEASLNLPREMGFFDRVYNTIFVLYSYGIYHWLLFPNQNEQIKKYFPNGPHINDVLYNSSLMFLNSHTSINQPVPIVPNMIEIGGFHVKPPKKLPQDLQEYLDNAKEGVVYFSMGSNLKSAHLPVEKRDAIIKAFSKLKQNVLWKWEADTMPNQPANVKLSKWLPQADILAHPNVKLFITHGGLLSTTETIYHGKPVLAIPIFGDQKMNAQTAVKHGYGLVLPFGKLREEILSAKIDELLTNPSYSQRAKLVSKLFHDRPIKPLDLATYWVDYVARHRGAPHLRVAGVDLPWYQYHLIDVFAFLGVIAVINVIVGCYILKKICRRFCAKKNAEKKKSKKE